MYIIESGIAGKIHCVYSKRNHNNKCTCKKAESQEKFIVFIARGITIINVHVEKRNHRKIHCAYSKRNHNNRCTCKKAESQEKFIVFIARGIIIINVHVRKRNRRKNSLCL